MTKPWDAHAFGVNAEPVFCINCESEIDPRSIVDVCDQCLIPRGFRMWVKQELKDDRETLASYLYHCIVEGPRTNIAWDLLKATGDKKFDTETFRKAADIVMKREAKL